MSKIGVFSREAVEIGHSTSIYLHVDGHEVEVTFVGDNPDDYKWPDKVVVGEVTKWVRVGCLDTSDVLRIKS